MKAILVTLALALAAPAAAQDGISYFGGAGVVLPVGATASEAGGVGLAIDLGLNYNIYPNLHVGGHIGYSSAFGNDIVLNGVSREGTFDVIGIAAGATYDIPMANLGKAFVSLDVGFYFTTLTWRPTDGRTPGEYKEQHLGAAANVGVLFDVWEALSVGPVVNVTFPAFAQFGDWMMLNGTVRFAWGF